MSPDVTQAAVLALIPDFRTQDEACLEVTGLAAGLTSRHRGGGWVSPICFSLCLSVCLASACELLRNSWDQPRHSRLLDQHLTQNLCMAKTASFMRRVECPRLSSEPLTSLRSAGASLPFVSTLAKWNKLRKVPG